MNDLPSNINEGTPPDTNPHSAISWLWLSGSDDNLQKALELVSSNQCSTWLRVADAQDVMAGGHWLEAVFELGGTLLPTYPDSTGVTNVSRAHLPSGARSGTTIEVVDDSLHGAGPLGIPAVVTTYYEYPGAQARGSGKTEIRFFNAIEDARQYARSSEMKVRLALNVELLGSIALNTAQIPFARGLREEAEALARRFSTFQHGS